jgi:DNA-directed RNA polymerase
MKSTEINTVFGGVRTQTRLEKETEKIDRKRSSNAISPNFIHSLDASHLMLTVNECRAEGITSFGMVHDSYGTHAGNTDTMNRLLRKTFIEMYSDDVFGKFRQAIIDQNPGQEVPVLPPPGNLDLAGVADSCYFFA